MNIIFIHDASDGRMIITGVPDIKNDEQGDYEETTRAVAEANGMHFEDCSWGSVGEMYTTPEAREAVEKITSL